MMHVAPLSTNSSKRHIIDTSSRVAINHPQEVTNGCISMLQREISNSKSAWLLVTDMTWRCPKPSSHRHLPKCLLRLPCLTPPSPSFCRSLCSEFFNQTWGPSKPPCFSRSSYSKQDRGLILISSPWLWSTNKVWCNNWEVEALSLSSVLSNWRRTTDELPVPKVVLQDLIQ